MKFTFEIKENDGIVIVSMRGNLITKEQVIDLNEELDFQFTEGVKKIVIDLDGMVYMNSTGLNVLINILTQCRNKGGDAVVVNIPESINKLLVITKLNSVFNVEEDIEDAIKVLNN